MVRLPVKVLTVPCGRPLGPLQPPSAQGLSAFGAPAVGGTPAVAGVNPVRAHPQSQSAGEPNDREGEQ